MAQEKFSPYALTALPGSRKRGDVYYIKDSVTGRVKSYLALNSTDVALISDTGQSKSLIFVEPQDDSFYTIYRPEVAIYIENIFISCRPGGTVDLVVSSTPDLNVPLQNPLLEVFDFGQGSGEWPNAETSGHLITPDVPIVQASESIVVYITQTINGTSIEELYVQINYTPLNS